jgi:hypothetical protein
MGRNVLKVRFEFSGGSRHGLSDSSPAAASYYAMTNQGMVGKRVLTVSPVALERVSGLSIEQAAYDPGYRSERYEVVECRVDEGASEICVQCKFVGFFPDR